MRCVKTSGELCWRRWRWQWGKGPGIVMSHPLNLCIDRILGIAWWTSCEPFRKPWTADDPSPLLVFSTYPQVVQCQCLLCLLSHEVLVFIIFPTHPLHILSSIYSRSRGGLGGLANGLPIGPSSKESLQSYLGLLALSPNHTIPVFTIPSPYRRTVKFQVSERKYSRSFLTCLE